VCQTKIQRIVHADNETNYCARCQTPVAKLLADRALSKLFKASWPERVGDSEKLRPDRRHSCRVAHGLG